jgi:predicted transposase/invertase (TIGR01784 family)
MAQSYDHIVRENIAALVEVFFYNFMGIQPISSQRQDPNLPITLEKKPDYVSMITLPSHTEPIILHLEIQTQTDSQMHLRMFEYNALLRRKFGLHVMQCVILLSGDGKNMPSKIQFQNLDFAYSVIPFEQVSLDSLLDTGVPELLVMAILANFESGEERGVIRRILVLLRERVTDAKELQKYLTQLNILSNINNISQLVRQEISAMNILYDPKKDAYYQEVLDYGIEKGIEQGIEQGAKKTQLEFARKLLQSGQTIEFTAEMTGLKIEQIIDLMDD